MKQLISTIAIALLLPVWAMAAINLPEPAELMQKAKQNRIALREVMLDIEMNLSEMRDQPTFEKYFYMLDDLSALSVSLKLDEIYPKMTERLGLKMTGVGMRWLDVTKDSTEKIQYYIKWMDANTLSRFLDNLSYQISFVKDQAKLAVMAKNIEASLPLIDARSENQVHILLGYRRLITDVAILILRNKNLPAHEVTFWIGKLMMPASVSEYLEILNQDIYALNAENKDNSHEYLHRLLLLNAQVESFKDTAPGWLTNAVGDAVVELLLRAVRLEVVLNQQQFSQALSTLKIRSTLNLIQQWTVQEKVPTQVYADHYLNYSTAIVAHARKIGMTKDADEMSKWLARAAVPVMAKKLNLQGNYQLTNELGEKWFFTISYARENMLVAAIGSDSGVIFKTFYNITYSGEIASFVASEREPDSDDQMNPPIKFMVNDKGQIKLIDPYIRIGSQVFTGHKVQSFPDMWETFQGPGGEVDGTYEGTLHLASGPMRVKVIVTSFGGYTLGRLDSAEGLTIEFNIGTKGTDGVLILTSGRNSKGGTWFQLRGHLTPEGLNAHVVIGGKSQSPKVSFLKRK